MKRNVKIREEKRRKSIEFWDPQALLCAHEFLLLLLCVCVSFGRTWQESQSERRSTLSLSQIHHITFFFSPPLIAHSFGVVCPWCFVCTFFCVCLSFFFSLLSLLSAHTDKHGFSAGHWCKYLKPHYALRKLRRCPPFFTECKKVEFG